MPRKSPTPSIESQGVDIHIDDYFTKIDSDHTADEFVKYYSNKISNAGIARLLGISRNTANKWVDRYEKERQIGKYATN